MSFSIEDFKRGLEHTNTSGKLVTKSLDVNDFMRLSKKEGIVKIITLIDSIITDQEVKLQTYSSMRSLLYCVPHSELISRIIVNMEVFVEKLFRIDAAKYVDLNDSDETLIMFIAKDFGFQVMFGLVSKIITDLDCRVKTYSGILSILNKSWTVDSLRSSFPNKEEFDMAFRSM